MRQTFDVKQFKIQTELLIEMTKCSYSSINNHSVLWLQL